MTTLRHQTPHKWGQIKRARWGEIELTFAVPSAAIPTAGRVPKYRTSIANRNGYRTRMIQILPRDAVGLTDC